MNAELAGAASVAPGRPPGRLARRVAPFQPNQRCRRSSTQTALHAARVPIAAAAAATEQLAAGPDVATPAAAAPSGAGALNLAVHALKTRLEQAVMAELYEQQRQQTAAYSRSSAQRLQAEGLVLLGLLAAAEGRLYTDFVWRFSLPAGAPLPYHRFKRGDTLILGPAAQQRRPTRGSGGSSSSKGSIDNTGLGSSSSGDSSEDGDGFMEGTVLEVHRQEVLLTVAKPVAEALGAAGPGTAWRLNQGVSSATTRRQLAALSRLDVLMNPACKGEAAVRALLLGSPQAEAVAKRPTAWAQEQAWRADAGDQLRRVQGLNPSQRRAIATALTRTLTLWQGPPGTGKTRTLLALMEVLVHTASAAPLRRRDMGAILAVADTNAAADNLLEGLLQRGIQAVRVGQPAKVRPELRAACVNAQVERTRAGQRAAKLRAAADVLLQQIRQAQQQDQLWLQQQGQQQGQQGGVQGQEAPRQQKGYPQQPAGEHQGQGASQQQQIQQQVRQAGQQPLRQQQQQARSPSPPPRQQPRQQQPQPAEQQQQQQQQLVNPDLLRDWQRRADALWREADSLEAEAAALMLHAAPVVVATCNGAGEGRLDGHRFRVVVLDEASQATEASSLVALVKGAECVVMAGDQKQLPPTVLSQAALDLNLDVPLFTRLLEGGMQSALLDEQYRMHPAIAAFPSLHFYGGRVRSGVTAQDRPPVQGVPWSSPSCPILFINVDGPEERSTGGDGSQQPRDGSSSGSGGSGGGGRRGQSSYTNPAEAEVAMKALLRVLHQDESLQSIALLSPYSGQVRLLNTLLARAQLPAGAAERCSVTVSTVDGYQGREADCVIFSAVRCNDDGRVGFLADERRLNVAITRPRRGLIIIGNQATLAHDPTWRAWMQWVGHQRAQRQAEQQQVAAEERRQEQQERQPIAEEQRRKQQ